jgi:iron(III) transport system substrate-binding protein
MKEEFSKWEAALPPIPADRQGVAGVRAGRNGEAFLAKNETAKILLGLAAISAAVCAQPPAEETGRIYLYQGADREQRLVSAAKHEGVVSLYTSMQTPDSLPLAQAFEKKYGVKVSLWRASGEKLVQRALTEARGGRFDVDVMETDGAQMEILYREKQLAPFHSPRSRTSGGARPAAPALRSHARQPVRARVQHHAGRARRGAEFIRGPAAPQMEGQARPGGRPTWPWFAAVAKAMGREKGLDYFQKLAASAPAIRSGHTLLAELVSSGEILMVPDAHVQGVERLKKRGAPVGWKPLQPAFGQPSSVGLSRRAPHPHARCSSPTSSCPGKDNRSSRRATAFPRAARSTVRSTSSTMRWSIR